MSKEQCGQSCSINMKMADHSPLKLVSYLGVTVFWLLCVIFAYSWAHTAPFKPLIWYYYIIKHKSYSCEKLHVRLLPYTAFYVFSLEIFVHFYCVYRSSYRLYYYLYDLLILYQRMCVCDLPKSVLCISQACECLDHVTDLCHAVKASIEKALLTRPSSCSVNMDVCNL